MQATPTLQPATLSPLSNSAGRVFCMAVDQSHCHDSSAQSFVSTISTFIDEIALEDRLSKTKTITKPAPKQQRRQVAVWTRKDISTLVDLLRKFGSDFTAVSAHMDKSREQVKRKFKVLQKKFPQLAEVIFEKQPTQAVAEIQMEELDDFFMND